MSEPALKIVQVEQLIKLDLGCGQNPREGFQGVDLWAPDAQKVDLLKFPWPFETASVDEAHCSHFIEHIPMRTAVEEDLLDACQSEQVNPEVYVDMLNKTVGQDLFFAFFDELYRILKPNAKATIIWPALQSVRAFQDPTHRRFIPAESMLYLSAEWRKINKLDHYRVGCNFGVSVNPTVQQAETLRHPQVGGNRVRELWNVAIDFHAVLTALK